MDNPEFEIDLHSKVRVQDIGDLPQGMTLEEAQMFLSATVGEIIRLGGIPFILGGHDCHFYHSAIGCISNTESDVGIVSINPLLNAAMPSADAPGNQGCSTRSG